MGRTNKLGWLTRTALAGFLVAAPLSLIEAEAQEREFHLNIPAQPLSEALRAYARASGEQIVFTEDLVAGREASALEGDYTAEAALDALLRGTGLVAVRTPRGAVMILREGDPRTASADPASLPQLGDAARAAPSEDSVEEEIVVTGTHIRGLENRTAPNFVFDRQTIEDSGQLSTQDFMRSVPQNFMGGSNGASLDGQIGLGFRSQTNLDSASGVNLRGLGNSATLVLLNGHRVAVSGNGAVVDVSLFPLDAVERIEMVTDGSSAIYGADAIGGVVNFVLRDRFDGAETTLRYGAAEGGANEFVAGQSFGRAWSSGSALANIQYRDRTDLETSDRSFTAAAADPTDIIPDEDQVSGLLSLNQDLPGNFDFSADILYAHKHLLRDINLITPPASQRRDESDTYSTSVSMTLGYDTAANWRIEAMILDSRTHLKYRTSFTPDRSDMPDGAPRIRNQAHLTEFAATADGPLFSLPGGPLRAAIGVAYREEEYSNLIITSQSDRHSQRDVRSAFVELYAPLVGDANGLPLIHRLDLSAAVRHDDYSDFGGTTNPKIGLLWAPIGDLSLRAAYSTSFRAPDGSEQAAQEVGQFINNTTILPAPGGVVVGSFLLVGAEPALDPETATGFTAGIDYRPSLIEGLTVNVGYYRIDFEDRIASPPFSTAALFNAAYAPLITAFANDAEAAAFLAAQIASGAAFTDALGTGSTGVRYALNLRQQNLAILNQAGYDLTVGYRFDIGGNAFDVRANASLIEYIETAFTEAAPIVDIVDTAGNPSDLRARLDLAWSRGPIRLAAAVNYVDGYTDTRAAPFGRVTSWTTWDATAQLAPESWRGLSLGLSALNLFDEEPPRVASGGAIVPGINYDGANADPRGRFVAVQARKRW